MTRLTILLYAMLVCPGYSEPNLVGNDHGVCRCEYIDCGNITKGTKFKCINFDKDSLRKMTIPKGCDVSNLKRVEFSNNRIENISIHTFFSLNDTLIANITQLYLHDDSISNIDRTTFQKFAALEEINLRVNSITLGSLMSAFGYLKKSTIKTLLLDTNNIGNLRTATFAPLQSLEVLDIKNNGIHSIANGTFANLHNLHNLDFTLNSLTKLELHDLKALDKLRVRQNKLLTIPRFMNGNKCILTSLTELHLSDNAITSLGNFVGDSKCLGKLKTLRLGGNKIHIVDPNVFDNLKLQHLDISNFPLTNWSQQMTRDLLKSQTILETLYMNKCGLEELPNNIFTIMMNLTMLSLTNNRISSWTTTTFSKEIHYLHLQGNRIRLVNQSTFPASRLLDISSNPFTCDCRLQWFRTWIKSNSGRLIGSPMNYKCESPKAWNNKLLKSFNPTYVDCNPWNPYVIVAIAICITLILLVLLANIIQSYKDRFHSCFKRRCQYKKIRPDSIDRTDAT